MGVDDDELLCELSDPPLSSVAPDTLRTGYEAAALLDRLMNGQAVERQGSSSRRWGWRHGGRRTCWLSKTLTWRRPCGSSASTRARASTSATCWRRAGEPAGAEGAVQEADRPHATRRDRPRAGRAGQAVAAQTDLPMGDIARRTGFDHAEYLSVVLESTTACRQAPTDASTADGPDESPPSRKRSQSECVISRMKSAIPSFVIRHSDLIRHSGIRHSGFRPRGGVSTRSAACSRAGFSCPRSSATRRGRPVQHVTAARRGRSAGGWCRGRSGSRRTRSRSCRSSSGRDVPGDAMSDHHDSSGGRSSSWSR